MEAKVNAGLKSRFYMRVLAEDEQGRLIEEQMEKERQRSRERLK
jgi:truncated hemoglobin YjbI